MKDKCENAKKHCWHDSGIMLLSDPPQMDYWCCWCGKIKHVTLYACAAISPGHGPYEHGGKKEDKKCGGF